MAIDPNLKEAEAAQQMAENPAAEAAAVDSAVPNGGEAAPVEGIKNGTDASNPEEFPTLTALKNAIGAIGVAMAELSQTWGHMKGINIVENIIIYSAEASSQGFKQGEATGEAVIEEALGEENGAAAERAEGGGGGRENAKNEQQPEGNDTAEQNSESKKEQQEVGQPIHGLFILFTYSSHSFSFLIIQAAPEEATATTIQSEGAAIESTPEEKPEEVAVVKEEAPEIPALPAELNNEKTQEEAVKVEEVQQQQEEAQQAEKPKEEENSGQKEVHI
jgi:hypothetical protein